MTDLVRDVLYRMCKAVDTPKSLGVWLRYEHAQDELATINIDPKAYNDAASFFADYSCVCLLKKFKGLKTGIDTKKVALLGFDKAEEQCRLTNERLRSYSTTGRIDQVEPAILAKAQQLIAKVWGSPSFNDLFRYCSWGPGATATLSSARSTTENKMSELPMSVTPTALPFLRQVMKYDLAWNGHLLRCPVDGPVTLLQECFREIPYSRLLTVSKDAKTDRTIAAEPTGNIFLQLGLGRYLNSRLSRVGVNLVDQTRNKALASSALGLLATLDLSSASDTVAIELCRVLLPPDMFSILDSLRSPAYKLGGEVRRFHKFSSMGNGFTFQLESLLFWATAKAVQSVRACRGPIGVYGDDIIVPQAISQEVVTVLEAFGFAINKEKSYVDGRFFESCGGHYFDGFDVTPIYQKQVVDNDLEICRFVNRVYELSYARPFLGSERFFGKVHSAIFSRLPKTLRNFTGPGWAEGDGFFRVLNFSGEFSMNRGYRINYMAAKKPKKRLADGGLYAYMLRKTEQVPVQEKVSPGWFFDLSDFWTEGHVTPRPRGRIVAYKRSKRWIPLLMRGSSRGYGQW